MTACFTEGPHIALIKWPGNDPDLIPIVNVWALMKRQLKDCHTTNMGPVEGIDYEAVGHEGARLAVLYLRNLVESMPRKLHMVIEIDGGSTEH